MWFVMHPADAAASTSGTSVPYRAWIYRSGLVLAIAVGTLLGLALTLVAPDSQREPELTRLLHGMVLIKGLIGLAIVALVWWRMSRPLPGALAIRYSAALAVSFAAAGWLWGLTLVPLGSLVFYAGLGAVALAARRDPLFSRTRPNRA
jgi:uncharacterized integral membrane protein